MKKLWVTDIFAIDPKTGNITHYCGPSVPGETWQDAENYCQTNGLGYCEVVGELICEIPLTANGMPDWDNAVHYVMDMLGNFKKMAA